MRFTDIQGENCHPVTEIKLSRRAGMSWSKKKAPFKMDFHTQFAATAPGKLHVLYGD